MFGKLNWPNLEFDELKKRTRILVIDDNPFEYEGLFKDAHYSLDKWDDVKDVTALEKGAFDIILLDIQGVGKGFSKDQGFGILKHLKNVNPSQIIIAYSNSDYKLAYQDFFKLANDTLDKSQDFYNFKEAIDKHITLRFSYDYYFNIISTRLGSNIDKTKLNKHFAKAIKKNDDQLLKNKLLGFEINQEAISFVLNVLSFAIDTYTTLHGMKQ
jgi:CheY-like chemotaxis protein